MERVVVENLNKVYPNNTVANRDISFGVHSKECLCILGPNGAGKTTLLNQIATFIKPTSGTIRICGVNAVKQPNRVKKHLGIMPQVCSPYHHLTMEQHFKIFSKIKGFGSECYEHLLNILGLETRWKTRIGLLSVGQKRKLLLATALMGKPDVLLLDEPTTGLSPESRIEVWNIINREIEQGAAIILTTHMFQEAESLANRFGVLNNGRLVFVGNKHELAHTDDDKYELIYRKGGFNLKRCFSEIEHATDFVKKRHLDSFVLSQVSLEQLYFQIIGKT